MGAAETVVFELQIERPAPGARDAAKSLHQQLRQAIIDGRLAAGARLPPTRLSLQCFGVSRNTLAEVYERLLDEEMITTRRGAGTYVAARRGRSPTRHDGRETPPPASRQLNPFWLSEDVRSAMGFWDDLTDIAARRTVVDFRPAQVDSREFPHATFRRLMAQQLRALDRRPPSARGPSGNQGNRGLRAAIAHHIALTRAVACASDEIVVTAGAQQAFDLLARVLVIPGSTVVAVEDPGYPPMRVAFAAAGASVVPVPIDEEGLRVDAIPRDARVVCLCPSHQFPIGVTMSARRRAELLAFARSTGAVVVEDDYDGEFRLEGSPLPALRTLDAADVVCYVGTFSKCMLPSLRLGFVIPPAWMLDAATAAKNCADWHCPTATQLGVAAFMQEGHLARHIRRMRGIYAARKQHLWRSLEADFAGLLTPVPSSYGMHVCALTTNGLDVEPLCAHLRADGVELHSLSRYHLGTPTRAGLVFGLGTSDEAAINRGLRLLRKAANGLFSR
ncbi:MocR-like pyridoxine biosynthesis transcription factor PdxR [Piscinibacter terrae]|uniref:PLP-dependent aminotransferase family protein n=1 Tax=Piscinibacter terrae TaxID=2496871 RepID=A0A3N7HMK8_9BURK|nr:PLP-dependent aminotransferase family protein [Albitalea terrae]RQP23418.1 PLP-dependent aminotransferase family protein [Albitalea terrae]